MPSRDTMKHKVLNYNAIFQKEDDGGYSVWIPALPGCTSQGETFEEALANIQEAMALYLEDDQDEQDLETDTTKQFMVPVSVSIHA